MLSEDFISSIIQQGKEIFIGYRMQGVDVLDAENDGESENKEGAGKRGCSFLAGASGRECLGGDIRTGLCSSEKGTLAYKLDREQLDNEVPFPRPAQMEEPSVVLRRLERLGSDAHAGKNIVFRGEDWTTKGDWCGKYGHTRATLCATNAP